MPAPTRQGRKLGEIHEDVDDDSVWVWLGLEMGWVESGTGRDPDWGMGPMKVLDPRDLVDGSGAEDSDE